MILRIPFKTPDAADEAIKEAVREYMRTVTIEDEEERLFAEEDKRDELEALVKRWIQYGEYITIEIDAAAKSCHVVEVS